MTNPPVILDRAECEALVDLLTDEEEATIKHLKHRITNYLATLNKERTNDT